ncbi:MAG: cytochrome P450 [Ardenticatenaceae bacterium]|nr:cytochrome P450 [Ardenticatenaceae bacterium]
MTDKESLCPLPVADGTSGSKILKELLRDRSLLTSLSLMRKYVGPAFQITLPGFQPAVFAGPDTNREIMVSKRDQLKWRKESDPVAKLLRRGVLVVDGEEHDALRAIMDPPLHRRHVVDHIEAFWRYTNDVIAGWENGRTVDMLVEMRKVALLIFVGTLFKVEFGPDLERMWQPILTAIRYISPGFWIIFPNLPRPQYRRAIAQLDDYLYQVIARRRASLRHGEAVEPGDLLGQLLQSELDDGRVRDQMLTMLIAGHDTSTALLAWVLYLLGSHPEAMARAKAEVTAVLTSTDAPPTLAQINQLSFLDNVIKEALRLYPPIHAGNRHAASDLELGGFHVPADTRVMVSIYLTHRDERYWEEPAKFCPQRFDYTQEDQGKRPSLAYVPFGGGPRNCIGAAFAQVESKVVLARILQRFDLALLNGDKIKPYMGATLEPHPGVLMRVRRPEARHAG